MISTNPTRIAICELMSVNLNPLKIIKIPVTIMYANVIKSVGYIVLTIFLQGILLESSKISG